MSKILGLLIFDYLNDIVYIKCNKKFVHHVQKLAVNQGLIPEGSSDSRASDQCSWSDDQNLDDDSPIADKAENEATCLDKDVVIQMFSPLVASYRIMKGQFKNPYESLSCEDGTKFVFQEYSSHLFLCIGAYSQSYLNRFTNVSIKLSQFILGPCISVLKSNREKSQSLDCLLSAWIDLYSRNQSFLVEGIQRLIVNAEVSSAAVYALSIIVNALINVKGIGSGHALFFVRNKLLTLYSSKNAEELLESDVLAVNLLLKANCLKDENLACMNPTSFQEEVPLSPTSPEVEGFLELEVVDDNEDEMPSHSDEDILRMGLSEYLIFLQTKSSPLAPHIAYMCSFTSELSLVVLAQVNRSLLSGQLVEVFRVIEDLKNEELTVKQTPLIEIVDNSLRNSQDFMKWIPASSYPKIKKCLFQLCNKWEALKKNDLEEWLRSSTDCVLSSRLEAGVSSFMNCLRNTWKVACLDVTCPAALSVIVTLAAEAKEKLSKYFVSLEPEECLKSMSLGSCSIISINKYLEEFPGLVHFIYIDRSTHQLTAPPLWTSEQEGVVQLPPDSTTSPSSLQAIRHLTAAKIWSMVDFARDHLAKGHCTVLWKDKTFSYSYFLWFEDQGGNPLKPVNLNKDILKTFPQTGLLCGDFYKVYATKAFPNNSPSSLRGFELYCVHIGLATSPCILEQTRRLAASIWEIAGPPSTNPIDLL